LTSQSEPGCRGDSPDSLGTPGEIVYQAAIELPAGQKPVLPNPTDVIEDFAEYHSRYAWEGNTLTATRRFVIKKKEVALSSWDQFRRMRKSVQEDEGRWADVSNVKAPSASGSNPEADKLFAKGMEAYQAHDTTGAEQALRRVLGINASYPSAHGNLGIVYLAQNKPELAVDELRKEEDIQPGNAQVYRLLAFTLSELHRNDEAMEQWRRLLRVDPGNREAAVRAGHMLLAAHRYADTIELLESAYGLSPDDEIKVILGAAYLQSGKKDKGITLLHAAPANSDYRTLGALAFALADNNLDLENARKYAESAMRGAEAASPAGGSDKDALEITRQLGPIWDTVGWVYFRMGYVPQAEPFLKSAWDLTQQPEVAGHLAQLLESQGKRADALHMLQLGLAASGETSGKLTEQYEKLAGEKNLPAANLSAAKDELIRARWSRIEGGKHAVGETTFSLAVVSGSIDQVQCIRGDRQLCGLADSITNIDISFPYRTGSKARVFRLGQLSCTTKSHCDFALILPDSIPAPP
jgi:tetratricopeptide (TPR) repeat protein